MKDKGLNAFYSTLGFYPEQYYKTISANKKYDVSFMGTAFRRVPQGEDKRTIYLQSLKSYKLGVYGESFKNKLRGIRVRPYRGHDTQRTIYGKSKIVPFVGEWRAERKYAGGGILLDQGIHMVDLIRLFCGEFEEVKSLCYSSRTMEVKTKDFIVKREDQTLKIENIDTCTRCGQAYIIPMGLCNQYCICGFKLKDC